jgi:hypothetical protein
VIIAQTGGLHKQSPALRVRGSACHRGLLDTPLTGDATSTRQARQRFVSGRTAGFRVEAWREARRPTGIYAGWLPRAISRWRAKGDESQSSLRLTHSLHGLRGDLELLGDDADARAPRDRQGVTRCASSGLMVGWPQCVPCAFARAMPALTPESLREIAAELAQRGYLNERGVPFLVASINSMLIK